MLGKSNLYFRGPKATIYSTCIGVKYAGNPLTIRETTIYKISLTPPQTHGGSTPLSLEKKTMLCLVWDFVKKSANCNSEGTYWSVIT
jgi:hypothetical protein